MRPIYLAFFLFIVCRIFLFYLTLCDTSSFSHDQLKWYSPSFSNTTFRNFHLFLIYFPKCPSFSTITMLRSKCGTLLVSSSNLSPICWSKVFFLLKTACNMATSVYKILDRNFKRRQISKPICVNVSTILKGTVSDVVHVAQDKAQWPAVV